MLEIDPNSTVVNYNSAISDKEGGYYERQRNEELKLQGLKDGVP